MTTRNLRSKNLTRENLISLSAVKIPKRKRNVIALSNTKRIRIDDTTIENDDINVDIENIPVDFIDMPVDGRY